MLWGAPKRRHFYAFPAGDIRRACFLGSVYMEYNPSDIKNTNHGSAGNFSIGRKPVSKSTQYSGLEGMGNRFLKSLILWMPLPHIPAILDHKAITISVNCRIRVLAIPVLLACNMAGFGLRHKIPTPKGLPEHGWDPFPIQTHCHDHIGPSGAHLRDLRPRNNKATGLVEAWLCHFGGDLLWGWLKGKLTKKQRTSVWGVSPKLVWLPSATFTKQPQGKHNVPQSNHPHQTPHAQWACSPT